MPTAIDMPLEGSGYPSKEKIPNAVVLLKANNFNYGGQNYQIADGIVAKYSTDGGQTWNWVRVYKNISEWSNDTSFLTFQQDQFTKHHSAARNNTDITVWCSATLDSSTTSDRGKDDSYGWQSTDYYITSFGYSSSTSEDQRHWETDIYVNNNWVKKVIFIKAAPASILKVRFSGSPDYDVDFSIPDNIAAGKWDRNKYYRFARRNTFQYNACFRADYCSVSIEGLQMEANYPQSASYQGVGLATEMWTNVLSGGQVVSPLLRMKDSICLADQPVRIITVGSNVVTNAPSPIIIVTNNIFVSKRLRTTDPAENIASAVYLRYGSSPGSCYGYIANNLMFGFAKAFETRRYTSSVNFHLSRVRVYNNIMLVVPFQDYVPYHTKFYTSTGTAELDTNDSSFEVFPIYAGNLVSGRFGSSDSFSRMTRVFNTTPVYPAFYRQADSEPVGSLAGGIIQAIYNNLISLYNLSTNSLNTFSTYDFSFISNLKWPVSLPCLNLSIIQQSPYSYPCYNPADNARNLSGQSDSNFYLFTTSMMTFDKDIKGQTRNYWNPGPFKMKLAGLKKLTGQFAVYFNRSEIAQFE